MSKLAVIKVVVVSLLVVIAVSVVSYMGMSMDDNLTSVLNDYLSLVDRTSVGNRKDKFYEDFFDAYYTNTDITSEDNPDGIRGNKGSGGIRTNGLGYSTAAEAEAAIRAAADRTNRVTDAWKVSEVGGRFYVVEKQSKTWWGGISNGGKSTMSGQGCMWFAVAAMLSAKSDDVVTVSQLLQSVGYRVTSDSGGKYSIGENLPCVGNNSSKRYANGAECTPAGIVRSFNGRKLSDSARPNRSNIEKGSIYLVHVKNDTSRVVSSSGEHWFVVVGYDKSRNTYQLVNCKATVYNADEVDRLLNHAYEY